MEARWEGDERGTGVGDARVFAPDAERLVEAMRQDQWIAEEPELHLLPHLQQACRPLPFQVGGTAVTEDGVFVVHLDWTGSAYQQGAVRAAVYTLVGSFSEVSTHIRQISDADGRALSFDVTTGFLEGDGDFAPHGHAISIRVTLPDAD
jgi:hypothetical protein